MPDLWFYEILIFWAIVLKLNKKKYIDQGLLVLNLVKIDLSVQIVWDLTFFENFLKIL